jgi:phage terminase large subunit-like protein
MITCFSADEPDQLRGPQFHIGVADELAAHKQVKGADNLTAWQNMEFAVRLGNCPQIAALTTPKRVASIKKLIKDAKTKTGILLRRGKTADNIHLDPAWYQKLLDTYGGTEMGKQELEGEMLGAITGAIATQDRLDVNRVSELPVIAGHWLKYVGLDPSTSENFRDEAGIVVVYVPRIAPVSKRHAYIVEDHSDNYTPDQWAEKAVTVAHKHGATIVAEVNQGGSMVKNALAQVAKDLGIDCPPIRETWSSKAKAIRAEPVGIAIARGRVHMVGSDMELLEDELTSWIPTDAYSPDRLDAMVFGVIAGIFDKALTQGAPGTATTLTVADKRIELPRQVTMPSVRQQTRSAAMGGMRRIGRTAV